MAKNHVTVICSVALLIAIGASSCSQLAPTQETVVTSDAPKTASSATPSLATTERSSIAFSEDSSCWSIKPLQMKGGIEGSLIFGDGVQNAFAWDINSYRVRSIKNTSLGLSISSDGTTVFNLPWNQNKLTTISSESVKSYSLPKSQYAGARYLPDGKIFIGTGENILEGYKEGAGITDKFYVLDPATGEASAYSVFLPDFWLPLPPVVEIQFSPDLRYVVYRTRPGNEGQPKFNLLDINKNEIVWSGPEVNADMLGNQAGMPVWMPDASGLVYSWATKEEGENFYFISLTGEVTKFTQFQNAELEGVNSAQLPLPSWSPDGRYMAFGIKFANQDLQKRWFHLYIWDNEKKTVFKPCLPDEDNILDVYNIIWSFDSTRIALDLPYRGDNATHTDESQALATHSISVVLDLSERTIYQLPDRDNRGEYSSIYGKGNYGILGWVNWQIP